MMRLYFRNIARLAANPSRDDEETDVILAMLFAIVRMSKRNSSLIKAEAVRFVDIIVVCET